jgi:hypothetical protein
MPGAGAKKFDKFLHLTAHGPMGGPLKNIIGGRRPRRADRMPASEGQICSSPCDREQDLIARK